MEKSCRVGKRAGTSHFLKKCHHLGSPLAHHIGLKKCLLPSYEELLTSELSENKGFVNLSTEPCEFSDILEFDCLNQNSQNLRIFRIKKLIK